MEHNKLSRKFSAWGLLRFASPTIIMMVFMSLYTMVDGIFVSRLIGTTALSAVNIVYPLINLVVAVGIMLATGASAVVANQMGTGEKLQAKQNFTFIVLVGMAAGLLITGLGAVLIEPLLRVLGANTAVWDYCRQYTSVLLWFVPMAVLQMLFQYFFVVAGRPGLGLALTAIGGVANIGLDYLFIAQWNMGIAGAALATGIGYSIPGLFGLWFFAADREGSLCFVRPRFRGRVLLQSCINGSSEMVTNLSMAVITLLFNLIMMETLGEDGVAAITIVLYAEYLLVSIYLGYSSGVAPIISYKHGSGDAKGLRHIFKISLLFLAISSLGMFLAGLLLKEGIVGIFAEKGSQVWQLAAHGFFLYSFAYLFKGINIFASALFTALNDGKVSAVLSFLRTFLFIAAFLLLLPRWLGVDGVWLAVPLAEAAALALSLGFMAAKRKVYRYA